MYLRRNIILAMLLVSTSSLHAQEIFNAWLTTCAHMAGPTGDIKGFDRAVKQMNGTISTATRINWDILIDAGDWSASQHPPTHEEGKQIAHYLDELLQNDRGRYFTIAGNHDGEAKDWQPGSFTQMYLNPLGEARYQATSLFHQSRRPRQTDFRQLVDYPGTRWDRYLVRTGNVIWIMIGDRNEFDELALQRNDLSGQFQAGRGSAAGMPKGGYPSGAVTLDTFEWWKKVVEDPMFKEDILITVHHHLLAFTTTSTEDGEPGEYHGKSGSIGPNGETGGQLYWIREYDANGKELNQYAQTRPFEDYLKDHPGAITAWIGGHTHIHTPESTTSSQRGIQIQKYGVHFISVGALTTSHAPGTNQMSRVLTFMNGQSHAFLTPYIHRSADKRSLGLDTNAVYQIPLTKPFRAPAQSRNDVNNAYFTQTKVMVPDTTRLSSYRYRWRMDADKSYDFNSNKWIVGEDGSPYGRFTQRSDSLFITDPLGKYSKVVAFHAKQYGLHFNAPYTPSLNWSSITLSLNLLVPQSVTQELLVAQTNSKTSKFRLALEKGKLIWQVGVQERKRASQLEMDFTPYLGKWIQVHVVANSSTKQLVLWINGQQVAATPWTSKGLMLSDTTTLIVAEKESHQTWYLQDLTIYDRVISPEYP